MQNELQQPSFSTLRSTWIGDHIGLMSWIIGCIVTSGIAR